VIDFSRAVGAPIVTSFAVSLGTRDRDGAWTPDQARSLLDFTSSAGGHVVAAEFMNEPNVAAAGIAPVANDAAAYGRDFKTFLGFIKQQFPAMMILGPGMAGATDLAPRLLAASGPGIDVVSYHQYATLSERCTGKAAPDAMLSEHWLARTDQTLNFYRLLRDSFEPGKPIWLTETADAACGGNRSDATFLDTFRYLDQLGRLAKAGVEIVMHNTLAASDYGLIDENTLVPRPNYWGALLWRQLMGRTVLESRVPIQLGLHVYAHCQHKTSGGVSLLIINNDRDAPHSLTLTGGSQRYTLDAPNVQDGTVHLNGRPLELAKDELPQLTAVPTDAGLLTFAPATITFLAIPAAANKACL
jgi:hypothetical protein